MTIVEPQLPYLSFLGTLIVSLVVFVIFTPLSALLLWLSAKIFHVPRTYVQSLWPALILGVFSALIGLLAMNVGSFASIIISAIGMIVQLALYLLLPSWMLHVDYGKGALVGLVWLGFMIAANVIMLGFFLIIFFVSAAITGLI
ncbi:hypothetical protein GF342_00210 [Candidatus Woesearchaeota archaeon]|nr:hypothetical protein [Candidatus Woesearchaeota archaeon]